MPIRLLVLLALTAAVQAQNGPQYPAANYELLGDADAVALHDWTGDGQPDLVALHTTEGLVSFSPGADDGTFGAAVQLGTASFPQSLVVGDVDGDGNEDFCFVEGLGDDQTLRAFLSDGAGGFQDVASLIDAVPDETPIAVALGDVEGDGDLDAVAVVFPTVTSSSNPRIGWLTVVLNDGSGAFAATGSVFNIGQLPRGIAAGDFDGDGVTDYAVANNGSNEVMALLGDGAGGLSLASTTFAVRAWNLRVADLDGDGNEDVVVGKDTSDELSVLFGDGAGNFTPVLYGAVAGRFALGVGDLDGDGDMDVAAGNAGVRVHVNDGTGDLSTENVSVLPNTTAVGVDDLNADGAGDLVVGMNLWGTAVLLGDGSGSFGVLAEYDDEGDDWLEPGDFDGDGTTDLLISGFRAVRVRLGDGAGAFPTVQEHAIDVDPVAGVPVDLDGDGNLDAATANFEFFGFGPAEMGLSLLLGDGAGGFGAPTEIALVDAPASIAAGDLNGDGNADLAVPMSTSVTQIHLGDGMGGIAPGPALPAAGIPTYALPVDLNLDGDLDVATATQAGVVHVHLADGAGGFQPGVGYAAGSSPARLVQGDMNEDGLPDLVALNSFPLFGGGNGISVLHGTGGGLAPPLSTLLPASANVDDALRVGDVDGDGHLDAVTIGRRILVARGAPGAGVEVPVAYTFPKNGADLVLGDWNGNGFLDVAGLGFTSFFVHPNRQVAPAGITPYGTGTPGCDGVHLALADGPPFLGAPLNLTCNNAPTNGLGARFASIGKDEPGTLLLDVLVHVDPLQPGFFLVPASANANGIASAPVAIPSNPALLGVDVHEQWAWFWTGGPCAPSALGISTSRAVTLTIQ